MRLYNHTIYRKFVGITRMKSVDKNDKIKWKFIALSQTCIWVSNSNQLVFKSLFCASWI